MATSAIVLDIEGTTTPLSFVRDVLFPYARVRLAEVLRANASDPEFSALIQEATEFSGRASLELEEAIQLFLSWSDADRKVRSLKTLQGRIWKQGYLDGSLRAPMYPDVPPALHEWRMRGLNVFVYSSGSAEAQELIFRYSTYGDLTPYFAGYFDTTVGPKIQPASYDAMQNVIGRAPRDILFLSDAAAEIAAARAAGWCALLVKRDGLPPVGERAIESFSDIVL